MDVHMLDRDADNEKLRMNNILAAIPTSSFHEKIIIICPTQCDADIIKDYGTIELAGGTILVKVDSDNTGVTMKNEER